MRTVHETVTIRAPLERVFALSTNVELVQRTLGMKLLAGPKHVVADSRVHWHGWKFGLPTHHHTLITGYTAPHVDGGYRKAYFQDSQEQGRFAHFHHDHFFIQPLGNESTTLEDRVYFELPWLFGGGIAARFLLAPHIRRLARQRFALIKRLAESTADWQPYVS